MNRVDRLSAILIQLQSRKIVKAQEIADRFEISLRTVYRDIRSLEEAGVPIAGEAGVGYSLMEGYRLPPVMFTKEEATAFLMAEKVLERFSDNYHNKIFKAALYKIKAVLRSSEKDFIEDVDENIVVVKNDFMTASLDEQKHIPLILQAINGKNVLDITYQGMYAAQSSRRQIEPVGVFLMSNNWYLIAFCRLRNDYRNFKLSRIQSIFICESSFEANHKPVASYLGMMGQQRELHTVKLSIKKEPARYLVTEKYYHGFVSEEVFDDYVEMTFVTDSLKWFAKWFITISEYCTIISPLELTAIVKATVNKLQDQLK